MKIHFKSDTVYILGFFLLVIAAGTLLLSLPVSWAGSPEKPKLALIDSLFTATSAVCVTGLITVNTADYSRFGQTVILLLIQTGGLGIISFTSLFLLIPGRRLSFRRLRTIKSFSLNGVEHDPAKIVRDIVFFTLVIEILGALALYSFFLKAGTARSAFSALFHSISAFCNAGFSLFPESFEGFNSTFPVLIILSLLIITGGIGFIVLQDLSRRIRGRKKRLSYHTKLVLFITAILIVSGAGAFWFLEGNNTFQGMSPVNRAVNALFQSVTPRTAGFNAVVQSRLTQPSKYLTMLLMFIGGAPGSIAGGIKVSSAYVVLLFMLKSANEQGEINAFSRRISPATVNSAVSYFFKALFLLLLAVGLLSLFESPRGAELDEIVFEAVSAFGTVGLSLGITSNLSIPGKLTIIATMFTGRIGLIAFLFLVGSKSKGRFVYPEADILIG